MTDKPQVNFAELELVEGQQHVYVDKNNRYWFTTADEDIFGPYEMEESALEEFKTYCCSLEDERGTNSTLETDNDLLSGSFADAIGEPIFKSRTIIQVRAHKSQRLVPRFLDTETSRKLREKAEKERGTT